MYHDARSLERQIITHARYSVHLHA